LFEFFIKIETNPIFESQMWYPVLGFTIWITKNYIYPWET